MYVEEHRYYANDEHEGAANLDDVARKKDTQRLNIARAALHEIAGVRRVVERRMHVVQSFVQ